MKDFQVICSQKNTHKFFSNNVIKDLNVLLLKVIACFENVSIDEEETASFMDGMRVHYNNGSTNLHPQYVLGQHVCCNVIVYILENVVKPLLLHYCEGLGKSLATTLQETLQANQAGTAAVGQPHGGEETLHRVIEKMNSRTVMQTDTKGNLIKKDILKPFTDLVVLLHTKFIIHESTYLELSSSSAASTTGGSVSAARGAYEGLNMQHANSSFESSYMDDDAQRNNHANTMGNGDTTNNAMFQADFDGNFAANFASTADHAYNTLFSPSSLSFTSRDPSFEEMLYSDIMNMKNDHGSQEMLGSSASPSYFSHLPFLYKNGNPLNMIMNHIMEVLDTDFLILSSHSLDSNEGDLSSSSAIARHSNTNQKVTININVTFSSEYIFLLTEIFLFFGNYISQITLNYYGRLVERILMLFKKTREAKLDPGQNTNIGNNQNINYGNNSFLLSADDALLFAQLLCRLLSLPHSVTALDTYFRNNNNNGITFVLNELTENIQFFHKFHSVNLKFESFLLKSFKLSLIHLNKDFSSECKTFGMNLLKYLSAMYYYYFQSNDSGSGYDALTFVYNATTGNSNTTGNHSSNANNNNFVKRELWRLELFDLISVILSINFSDFLSTSVLYNIYNNNNKYEELEIIGSRDTSLSEPSKISPSSLKLLHENILELMFTVFSPPKHYYSFMSRRELLYFYSNHNGGGSSTSSSSSPGGTNNLNELFYFGSVVLYLAEATFGLYMDLISEEAASSHNLSHLSTGGSGSNTTLEHFLQEGVETGTGIEEESEETTEQNSIRVNNAKEMNHVHKKKKNDKLHSHNKRKDIVSPSRRFIEKFYRICFGNSNLVDRYEHFVNGTSEDANKHSGESSSNIDHIQRNVLFTAKNAISENIEDNQIFFLHLIAVPLTTLHFSRRQRNFILREIVFPLFKNFDGRLNMLLLQAIKTVVENNINVSSQGTTNHAMKNFSDASRSVDFAKEAFRWLAQTLLPNNYYFISNNMNNDGANSNTKSGINSDKSKSLGVGSSHQLASNVNEFPKEINYAVLSCFLENVFIQNNTSNRNGNNNNIQSANDLGTMENILFSYNPHFFELKQNITQIVSFKENLSLDAAGVNDLNGNNATTNAPNNYNNNLLISNKIREIAMFKKIETSYLKSNVICSMLKYALDLQILSLTGAASATPAAATNASMINSLKVGASFVCFALTHGCNYYFSPNTSVPTNAKDSNTNTSNYLGNYSSHSFLSLNNEAKAKRSARYFKTVLHYAEKYLTFLAISLAAEQNDSYSRASNYSAGMVMTDGNGYLEGGLSEEKEEGQVSTRSSSLILKNMLKRSIERDFLSQKTSPLRYIPSFMANIVEPHWLLLQETNNRNTMAGNTSGMGNNSPNRYRSPAERESLFVNRYEFVFAPFAASGDSVQILPLFTNILTENIVDAFLLFVKRLDLLAKEDKELLHTSNSFNNTNDNQNMNNVNENSSFVNASSQNNYSLYSQRSNNHNNNSNLHQFLQQQQQRHTLTAKYSNIKNSNHNKVNISKITLYLQFLQFLHFLLRLYKNGFWQVPASSATTRSDSNTTTDHTKSIKEEDEVSDIKLMQDMGEDMFKVSFVEELFSNDGEFGKSNNTTKMDSGELKSSNGKIYFIVLFICHYLEKHVLMKSFGENNEHNNANKGTHFSLMLPFLKAITEILTDPYPSNFSRPRDNAIHMNNSDSQTRYKDGSSSSLSSFSAAAANKTAPVAVTLGEILLSPHFACAESHHFILKFFGVLSRKCLGFIQHTFDSNKINNRNNNNNNLNRPIYYSSDELIMVQQCIHLNLFTLNILKKTKVLQSSIDPFIDANRFKHIIIRELFQQKLLFHPEVETKFISTCQASSSSTATRNNNNPSSNASDENRDIVFDEYLNFSKYLLKSAHTPGSHSNNSIQIINFKDFSKQLFPLDPYLPPVLPIVNALFYGLEFFYFYYPASNNVHSDMNAHRDQDRNTTNSSNTSVVAGSVNTRNDEDGLTDLLQSHSLEQHLFGVLLILLEKFRIGDGLGAFFQLLESVVRCYQSSRNSQLHSNAPSSNLNSAPKETFIKQCGQLLNTSIDLFYQYNHNTNSNSSTANSNSALSEYLKSFPSLCAIHINYTLIKTVNIFIPFCELAIAEKLGKKSMNYLSSSTNSGSSGTGHAIPFHLNVFQIKKFAAQKIYIILQTFSNYSENVIYDLIRRAKENILNNTPNNANNSTTTRRNNRNHGANKNNNNECIVSLLALAEAAGVIDQLSIESNNGGSISSNNMNHPNLFVEILFVLVELFSLDETVLFPEYKTFILMCLRKMFKQSLFQDCQSRNYYYYFYNLYLYGNTRHSIKDGNYSQSTASHIITAPLWVLSIEEENNNRNNNKTYGNSGQKNEVCTKKEITPIYKYLNEFYIKNILFNWMFVYKHSIFSFPLELFMRADLNHKTNQFDSFVCKYISVLSPLSLLGAAVEDNHSANNHNNTLLDKLKDINVQHFCTSFLHTLYDGNINNNRSGHPQETKQKKRTREVDEPKESPCTEEQKTMLFFLSFFPIIYTQLILFSQFKLYVEEKRKEIFLFTTRSKRRDQTNHPNNNSSATEGRTSLHLLQNLTNTNANTMNAVDEMKLSEEEEDFIETVINPLSAAADRQLYYLEHFVDNFYSENSGKDNKKFVLAFLEKQLHISKPILNSYFHSTSANTTNKKSLFENLLCLFSDSIVAEFTNSYSDTNYLHHKYDHFKCNTELIERCCQHFAERYNFIVLGKERMDDYNPQSDYSNSKGSSGGKSKKNKNRKSGGDMSSNKHSKSTEDTNYVSYIDKSFDTLNQMRNSNATNSNAKANKTGADSANGASKNNNLHLYFSLHQGSHLVSLLHYLFYNVLPSSWSSGTNDATYSSNIVSSCNPLNYMYSSLTDTGKGCSMNIYNFQTSEEKENMFWFIVSKWVTKEMLFLNYNYRNDSNDEDSKYTRDLVVLKTIVHYCLRILNQSTESNNVNIKDISFACDVLTHVWRICMDVINFTELSDSKNSASNHGFYLKKKIYHFYLHPLDALISTSLLAFINNNHNSTIASNDSAASNSNSNNLKYKLIHSTWLTLSHMDSNLEKYDWKLQIETFKILNRGNNDNMAYNVNVNAINDAHLSLPLQNSLREQFDLDNNENATGKKIINEEEEEEEDDEVLIIEEGKAQTLKTKRKQDGEKENVLNVFRLEEGEYNTIKLLYRLLMSLQKMLSVSALSSSSHYNTAVEVKLEQFFRSLSFLIDSHQIAIVKVLSKVSQVYTFFANLGNEDSKNASDNASKLNYEKKLFLDFVFSEKTEKGISKRSKNAHMWIVLFLFYDLCFDIVCTLKRYSSETHHRNNTGGFYAVSNKSETSMFAFLSALSICFYKIKNKGREMEYFENMSEGEDNGNFNTFDRQSVYYNDFDLEFILFNEENAEVEGTKEDQEKERQKLYYYLSNIIVFEENSNESGDNTNRNESSTLQLTETDKFFMYSYSNFKCSLYNLIYDMNSNVTAYFHSELTLRNYFLELASISNNDEKEAANYSVDRFMFENFETNDDSLLSFQFPNYYYQNPSVAQKPYSEEETSGALICDGLHFSCGTGNVQNNNIEELLVSNEFLWDILIKEKNEAKFNSIFVFLLIKYFHLDEKYLWLKVSLPLLNLEYNSNSFGKGNLLSNNNNHTSFLLLSVVLLHISLLVNNNSHGNTHTSQNHKCLFFTDKIMRNIQKYVIKKSILFPNLNKILLTVFFKIAQLSLLYIKENGFSMDTDSRSLKSNSKNSLCGSITQVRSMKELLVFPSYVLSPLLLAQSALLLLSLPQCVFFTQTWSNIHLDGGDGKTETRGFHCSKNQMQPSLSLMVLFFAELALENSAMIPPLKMDISVLDTKLLSISNNDSISLHHHNGAMNNNAILNIVTNNIVEEDGKKIKVDVFERSGYDNYVMFKKEYSDNNSNDVHRFADWKERLNTINGIIPAHLLNTNPKQTIYNYFLILGDLVRLRAIYETHGGGMDNHTNGSHSGHSVMPLDALASPYSVLFPSLRKEDISEMSSSRGNQANSVSANGEEETFHYKHRRREHNKGHQYVNTFQLIDDMNRANVQFLQQEVLQIYSRIRCIHSNHVDTNSARMGKFLSHFDTNNFKANKSVNVDDEEEETELHKELYNLEEEVRSENLYYYFYGDVEASENDDAEKEILNEEDENDQGKDQLHLQNLLYNVNHFLSHCEYQSALELLIGNKELFRELPCKSSSGGYNGSAGLQRNLYRKAATALATWEGAGEEIHTGERKDNEGEMRTLLQARKKYETDRFLSTLMKKIESVNVLCNGAWNATDARLHNYHYNSRRSGFSSSNNLSNSADMFDIQETFETKIANLFVLLSQLRSNKDNHISSNKMMFHFHDSLNDAISAVESIHFSNRRTDNTNNNFTSKVLIVEALKDLQKCGELIHQGGNSGRLINQFCEYLYNNQIGNNESSSCAVANCVERMISLIKLNIFRLFDDDLHWKKLILKEGKRLHMFDNYNISNNQSSNGQGNGGSAAVRRNDLYRLQSWISDYKLRYSRSTVLNNSENNMGNTARGNINLFYLECKVLHALGDTSQALNLLRSGGNFSLGVRQQSNPLRDLYKSPNVVNTLLLWNMQMHTSSNGNSLIQTTTNQTNNFSATLLAELVRDKSLTLCATVDPSGYTSYTLASLCLLLARQLQLKFRSHEYKNHKKSILAAYEQFNYLNEQVQKAKEAANSTSSSSGGHKKDDHHVILDSEQIKIILRRRQELSNEINNETEIIKKDKKDFYIYRISALNSYGRYLHLSSSFTAEQSAHSETNKNMSTKNTNAASEGEDEIRMIDFREMDQYAAYDFVEAWLHLSLEEDEEEAEEDNSVSDDRSTGREQSRLPNGIPENKKGTSLFEVELKELREKEMSLINKFLNKIPSSKFLILFSQLSANLGSMINLKEGGNNEKNNKGKRGKGRSSQSTSNNDNSESDPLNSIEYFTAEQLFLLVRRIAEDYPLDTVWPLLCLSHGSEFYSNSSSSNGSHSNRNNSNMYTFDAHKVKEATQILQYLKSGQSTSDPMTATYVKDAAKLSNAYLELAFSSPSQHRQETIEGGSGGQPKTVYRMNSSFKIVEEIKNLSVPLPTFYSSSHNSGSRYQGASILEEVLGVKAEATGIPTVMRVHRQFRLPGGVNAPKVIGFLLSDGYGSVRQLLKHQDDLRQDALIETFFERSNEVVLRNTSSCKTSRSTSGSGPSDVNVPQIHTYAVVPLSPNCGVVHWVENTVCFGEYIAGNINSFVQNNNNAHGLNNISPLERQKLLGGIHGKLFPAEYNTLECRNLLNTTTKGNATEKKKMLLYIYRHFTPVMHYYFLEGPSTGSHHRPDEATVNLSDWFHKKESYAQSVAASSMIGHIVGLGDRHGSNLLLLSSDAGSSSSHRHTNAHASVGVVHIDLGIAFDQNRLLAIPELVPFRMTRNVVDGLGVRGSCGPLLGYSATVLRAMKEERPLLLAVLRSLVHDPLTRWSVAAGRNNDTNTSGGKVKSLVTAGDAVRAIQRVEKKFSGEDAQEGGGPVAGSADSLCDQETGRPYSKSSALLRRQRINFASVHTLFTEDEIPFINNEGTYEGATSITSHTVHDPFASYYGYHSMHGAAGEPHSSRDADHYNNALHVYRLYQQAQSVDLLSKMFVGWSAWI